MHNFKVKIIVLGFIVFSSILIANETDETHNDSKYIKKIYELKHDNNKLKRELIEVKQQLAELKKDLKRNNEEMQKLKEKLVLITEEDN